MDYETKQTYVLKVEGANPHIDPQFIAWGPYKDEATIKVMRLSKRVSSRTRIQSGISTNVCVFVCFQISVENADEPPVFIAPSYTFEVEENAPEGTMVGRVHAKDTDSANNPVR